jgi:hypothetical protein
MLLRRVSSRVRRSSSLTFGFCCVSGLNFTWNVSASRTAWSTSSVFRKSALLLDFDDFATLGAMLDDFDADGFGGMASEERAEDG